MGGNLQAPFALSAILSAVLVVLDMAVIPETLAAPRPFEGFVNPLQFTRLFTMGDWAFTTVHAIMDCNWAVETKNWSTVFGLHCAYTLGLEATDFSRVLSLLGLAMVAQSPISSILIRKMSLRGFPSSTNVLTIAANVLRG